MGLKNKISNFRIWVFVEIKSKYSNESMFF